MTKRLLTIAGSDSGGGAGIQADIKTATSLGVYAASAITAVTAQNTLGVSAIHVLPPDIVAQQIDAILSDIGADVVKIGMLANRSVCEAVSDALAGVTAPIALDPVMVATSGDRLLDSDTIDFLLSDLIPRATVITPNLPEFDILFGLNTPPETERALVAQHFVERTGVSLLLKGGHAQGPVITNTLFTPAGIVDHRAQRLQTKHTHGTGCTLAAAMSCYLAEGFSLPDAASRAGDYVHSAIENAPGLGKGHGPLGFLPK